MKVPAYRLPASNRPQPCSRRRHRRFHIRPEALGYRYYRFDVPTETPSEHSMPEAEPEPEPELLRESDFRRLTALSGLRLVLVGCFWLLVILEVGWMVQLALQVGRALLSAD